MKKIRIDLLITNSLLLGSLIICLVSMLNMSGVGSIIGHLFVLLVIIIFFYELLFKTFVIKPHSYVIYKFQKWVGFPHDKYVTAYNAYEVNENARYFFGFKIKEFIGVFDIEKIEMYQKFFPNEYHLSIDDVKEEIRQKVSEYIKNNKSKLDLKVINFGEVETITFDKLLENYEKKDK